MESKRKKAIILGILLICGILFGILNSILALESPDYLVILSTIKTNVLIAVFFQAAMAIVYVWIAVLLYPILKEYNEDLATGYFGFRIIGAGFLFVGIGSLLLLLWVSQSFVSASQINSSHFEIIGELLRIGRDILNHIGMILPWSIGGLILYYCFFRMNLIPQWLSIWGFIGSVFTLVSTLLLMLTIIEMATPIYFIMNTPTALFELILAVFLMVKGFNPVDVVSHENRGKN